MAKAAAVAAALARAKAKKAAQADSGNTAVAANRHDDTPQQPTQPGTQENVQSDAAGNNSADPRKAAVAAALARAKAKQQQQLAKPTQGTQTNNDNTDLIDATTEQDPRKAAIAAAIARAKAKKQADSENS